MTLSHLFGEWLVIRSLITKTDGGLFGFYKLFTLEVVMVNSAAAGMYLSLQQQHHTLSHCLLRICGIILFIGGFADYV